MDDDFAYTWNEAVDELNAKAGDQLEYAKEFRKYFGHTPFDEIRVDDTLDDNHVVYIPRTTFELVEAYEQSSPGGGDDDEKSATALWLNNIAAKDRSTAKLMGYTLSLLTKLNPSPAKAKLNVLDAVSSYVSFVNRDPLARTFGGVSYFSPTSMPISGLFDWVMGLVTRDVQILPPSTFQTTPRFSATVLLGDSVLGERALATKRLTVFEGRAVHGPISSRIFYVRSDEGSSRLRYFNLVPVDAQDFNCLSMDMSQLRLLAFKGTGTFTFGLRPPCNAAAIFLPRIRKLAVSDLERWTWTEQEDFDPSLVFREVDLSGLDFTDEEQAQVVRSLLRRVSFAKLGGATSLEKDRATVLYAQRNTAAELLSSPHYPFGLARGCKIVSGTDIIEISGKIVGEKDNANAFA